MDGNAFDRDTALSFLAPGRYAGRMAREWWIERGPNGGYVAAVILRGLTLAAGDPDRTPRSFTVHYLAPPAEGDVELHTAVERQGRQLTFVSGRLVQGDRLLATAQAALAPPMTGVEFLDLRPPEVPPPEALAPTVMPAGGPHIPMRDRYEMRWAIGGAPFSGAPQALAGGWLRLTEPRPVDHLLVAAVTDAWMPPIFSRLNERFAVPTIDLTVHFRAPIAEAGMAADEWFLVVFRSQMAADGFVEEDGEVWSPHGQLLAHSRQLAVLLPIPATG